jgi:hypothetical protein
MFFIFLAIFFIYNIYYFFQGFDFIHNHGPVSGARVKELLIEAKVKLTKW